MFSEYKCDVEDEAVRSISISWGKLSNSSWQ